MTEKKKSYRRKMMIAGFALLTALLASGAATFAWYIYNTGAHTTSVKLTAGTFSDLLISDEENGEYSYTAKQASYTGELSPVSTNKILKGFQEVDGYREGNEGEPKKIANLFKAAPKTNCFIRTFYLKSTSADQKIYIKRVGFKDSREDNPMSAAIRMGIVTYKPGDSQTPDQEYIFEIAPDKKVQYREYNTEQGEAGCVLDADHPGGAVVKFTPYTPDNYCVINETTGEATLSQDSLQICTCPGGTPVRVDMYLWLEGCDIDCAYIYGNLSEISIEFIGYKAE